MSVKPQYETYRYVGEIGCLESQSIVECRLPGSEISGVLAVHAKAVPGECACLDGAVNYGGKVLLTIVYEDGDRKICRAERGAEFFHKAEGNFVTPACFAKVRLCAENVTFRREGSGLYVSVVVNARSTVYGSKQMEYLCGGEGVIARRERVTICKTVCVSGETEGEDEFDSDYVGDILLHSEKAVISRVAANAGQIEIDGEIALNICVLKVDEGVCSYERLVPFRMQVPCDEAFGDIKAWASVDVKSAFLSADADEEKGKSRIVLSYCLSADCSLSVKEEIEVVDDAFARDCDLRLEKKKEWGRYLTSLEKYTERVSGVAALSPTIEGEYTLQAAVLPRAELSCKKTDAGVEAEGVVQAEVFLVGADGTHRSTSLSLPVLFPIDVRGDYVEADCIVCGLNVRRKKEGEIEAEATLKLSVRGFEQGEWSYVCEAVEGEPKTASDAAFSIFIPRAGEDLWQVAKRLACTPEELQKSNPDMEFPVKEGKRLFVYRQIR